VNERLQLEQKGQMKMTDWQHALQDDLRGGQNTAHAEPFAIISSRGLDEGYKLFSNGEAQRDLSAEEVELRLREQGIDPATGWV
jgi:hypothetical protein